MEIYKNGYEYVIWEGNASYSLKGEWLVEDVVQFVKTMEDYA